MGLLFGTSRPQLWLAADDADAFITDPAHPEFLGECEDCGCFLSVVFGELRCQHCDKEEREAWEYTASLARTENEMWERAATFVGMPTVGDVEADVDLYLYPGDDERLPDVVWFQHWEDANRYGDNFCGVEPTDELFCLATVGVEHSEFATGEITLAVAVG
jgi:hypothetical protein